MLFFASVAPELKDTAMSPATKYVTRMASKKAAKVLCILPQDTLSKALVVTTAVERPCKDNLPESAGSAPLFDWPVIQRLDSLLRVSAHTWFLQEVCEWDGRRRVPDHFKRKRYRTMV